MQVAGKLAIGARRPLVLSPPALEDLPDGFELGLRTHGEGEALDPLAVEPRSRRRTLISFRPSSNVELGQRDAVDAVQL